MEALRGTSAAWSGAGDEHAVCSELAEEFASLNKDMSPFVAWPQDFGCLSGCEANEVMLNLLGSTNMLESFSVAVATELGHDRNESLWRTQRERWCLA